MPAQGGGKVVGTAAPGEPQTSDVRLGSRVPDPRAEVKIGRGPDTLRAIKGVREARQRLPTSLKLNTILAVLMVMVLAGAAISFYLV
ncbi:MAG TPA: hypothetical protein VGG33_09970, partial [Polyangia bacterium]